MPSPRTPVGLPHILPFVVRGVVFLSSESVDTHVRFRSSISSLSLRPVLPCPTLSPGCHHQESKDSVLDAGLACPDGIFTHLIGTPCLGAPKPHPRTLSLGILYGRFAKDRGPLLGCGARPQYLTLQESLLCDNNLNTGAVFPPGPEQLGFCAVNIG